MDWRVPVVVALALAAGCGGLTGTDAQSAETMTPAPVPTLPEETRTEEPELAPGLSTRGVTDIGALAAAHVAVLTAEPYAWHRTETRVRRFDNESVTLVENESIVVENDTTYRRQATYFETEYQDSSEFVRQYDVYAERGYEYKSWVGSLSAERTYLRVDMTREPVAFANYQGRAVAFYLDLDESTVSRVRIDGRTYYRLSGTRMRVPTGASIENYTARALIRSDGFVRQIEASYVIYDGGDPVHIHYNATYSEVGTATATQPDWLPEARAEFADRQDWRVRVDWQRDGFRSLSDLDVGPGGQYPSRPNGTASAT